MQKRAVRAKYCAHKWASFNPQSGFSNGGEDAIGLAPGKMRSIATGGMRGAHTPRAPTPQARTEGPTGATNGSAWGAPLKAFILLFSLFHSFPV